MNNYLLFIITCFPLQKGFVSIIRETRRGETVKKQKSEEQKNKFKKQLL